MSANGVSNF